MGKEAEGEKSILLAENGSHEEKEQQRPNGQEVIEKGNVHGGAEKVAVKMRAQKCRDSNDDKGPSEGSTIGDQNLSSALKRLAPTGIKQETEEEEENRQEQCGGFESTPSTEDQLQRDSSTVCSGNNTLKRNWRKSSKKKRKSTHIL